MNKEYKDIETILGSLDQRDIYKDKNKAHQQSNELFLERGFHFEDCEPFPEETIHIHDRKEKYKGSLV